jgi:hypothetical protein
MSVYTVNRVCWRLVRDPPFREAMKADASETLANEDLTDAERTAILTGDIGELHLRGAHDFLLAALVRYGVAGLTAPLFVARMRATAGLPLYEDAVER